MYNLKYSRLIVNIINNISKKPTPDYESINIFLPYLITMLYFNDS